MAISASDRYATPMVVLHWLMLLLLGVGATAASVPADRRRGGWLW